MNSHNRVALHTALRTVVGPDVDDSSCVVTAEMVYDAAEELRSAHPALAELANSLSATIDEMDRPVAISDIMASYDAGQIRA